MDFSPEKRKAAGDLKNVGSILRDLSEEFKGVVRIRMLREAKNYSSELILQNGFIIAASLSCVEDGSKLSGDKAFFGIVDLIKESSGGVEAYALSDSDFKPYVGANESMLLELVRGLGRTLEDIGQVDEDLRKGGLIDLEAEWKELESKWQQFEEREKPYLEMILKADLGGSSCNAGVSYEQSLQMGPAKVCDPPKEDSGIKDAGVVSSVEAVPVSQEVPSDEHVPSGQINASKDAAGKEAPIDEKGIDELILHEDPWEKISRSIGTHHPSERTGEAAGEGRPAPPESAETSALRQELRGGVGGSSTYEEKTESEQSQKTLSEDFNKRVRDAILGKAHHRLSENAVSAPKLNSVPARPQQGPADSASAQISSESVPDEWLARANATLQRLKKKKEGQSMPSPEASIAHQSEQVPPESAIPEQNAPERDTAFEATGALDQQPVEGVLPDVSDGEWNENVSSEINQLKRDADVYWGWDKKKKRFVGIDGVGGEGPEKRPDEPAPSDVHPKSKTPLAQCAVLREELKKQAAAVDSREIVISKEEVSQALVASQTPTAPQPQMGIPELKKKIGFLDKLKYAKYPQIVKVMEKVDGKKNVDELAKETKLTPAAVLYITEKLASDGYLVMKGNSQP